MLEIVPLLLLHDLISFVFSHLLQLQVVFTLGGTTLVLGTNILVLGTWTSQHFIAGPAWTNIHTYGLFRVAPLTWHAAAGGRKLGDTAPECPIHPQASSRRLCSFSAENGKLRNSLRFIQFFLSVDYQNLFVCQTSNNRITIEKELKTQESNTTK